MKKAIVFFTLSFLCISVNGQKLVLDQEGFKPYVFIVDTTFNSSLIFQKAINWVQLNYKNPDIVLKAKIENEYLRIEAIQQDAFYRIFKEEKLKSGTVMPERKVFYSIAYTLEINIKNGRYRFSYNPKEIYVNNQKVRFTLTDVVLNQQDINGHNYDGSAEAIQESVNKLAESLYTYIIKDNKEDW